MCTLNWLPAGRGSFGTTFRLTCVCRAELSTVCPLPSREPCLPSERKITSLDKLSRILLLLPLPRATWGVIQWSTECEVWVWLPSVKRHRVSVIKSKGRTILDTFDSDLWHNKEQRGRTFFFELIILFHRHYFTAKVKEWNPHKYITKLLFMIHLLVFVG